MRVLSYPRPESLASVKEYDGKVSEKIQEDASDPKRKQVEYRFVHACFQRERGYEGAADAGSPVSRAFISKTKRTYLPTGRFLRISAGDQSLGPRRPIAYGTPPQAKLMSDIKSLQSLARDSLIASSQSVRPPIATHRQERQLDLNPGRINPGLIDEQGRPLFRAMIDTVRAGAATVRSRISARNSGSGFLAIFGKHCWRGPAGRQRKRMSAARKWQI